MSRAIALDGFLQRSLVRDERRFTLQEAAVEFADMGYGLTRNSSSEQWLPPRPGAPRVFIAELKTACGCTRQIWMQGPTKPEIRIPLVIPVAGHGPARIGYGDVGKTYVPGLEGATYEARRFVHSGYRRMESGQPIYEYQEAL